MLKKILLLFILAILFNALVFGSIWVHRKFVMGLNPFLAPIMLVLCLAIIITLAVFVIKRLIKAAGGGPNFSPATTFLLGFFILLVSDLIYNLAFGRSTLDTHVHFMLLPALVFLAFFAIYFLFPKLIGRSMNAPMGYVHFGITLVGCYLLCWPAHYEGLAGMPRRYLDYGDWRNNFHYIDLNTFKIKVIIVLACAQILLLVNLIYSFYKGKK